MSKFVTSVLLFGQPRLKKKETRIDALFVGQVKLADGIRRAEFFEDEGRGQNFERPYRKRFNSTRAAKKYQDGFSVRFHGRADQAK